MGILVLKKVWSKKGIKMNENHKKLLWSKQSQIPNVSCQAFLSTPSHRIKPCFTSWEALVAYLQQVSNLLGPVHLRKLNNNSDTAISKWERLKKWIHTNLDKIATVVSCLFIYLFFIFWERERVAHVWAGEGQREGERERILNRLHAVSRSPKEGLLSRPVRSWSEPKSRIRCLTDWPTRAPLYSAISTLIFEVLKIFSHALQ